ncbi:MAG: GNAT family N-acetyltransferase [Burkholderiaceae bacterium]
MTFIKPITLKGQYATLEPLTPEHCDELKIAVADGELWKLWYTFIPKPQDMPAEIERRLGLQTQGNWVPFAIRRNDTKTICGMTNYMNIDAPNRRVEIGGTWHAKSAQRTFVNTECKLMLLTHAFENLKCISVEFRTNFMNHQSREAIARLGAKQDGILRNHMLNSDGTYRDTVAFSIIESEWPTVKNHLRHKLDR